MISGQEPTPPPERDDSEFAEGWHARLGTRDETGPRSYDGWGGGPGNPQNWVGGDNKNLGVPGSVSGPMRTVKLTARYAF